MTTSKIGERARELDSKEIIYRIRIGKKTMFRICLAVVIWLMLIMVMWKIL